MTPIRLAAIALLSLIFVGCDSETAVDKATREGIFIIGNGSEPKALDPQLITGVTENTIVSSLFEGLCNHHPSKDGIAIPGAAQSWESNKDFTVWTFHLQPKATWSDGKPVTARDFTFSYERILSPALKSKYAEMLYYIQGAEDFHKGNNTDFSQVGVKALDDYTLQVSLRGPIPFLPEITKHYTWWPVPKHVILKYGKIDQPFTSWTKPGNLVGNGPFVLKERILTKHIEVTKNPRYWDAKTVTLKGMRFLPITNPFTEVRMALDGQIHKTFRYPPELAEYGEKVAPGTLNREPYVGTRFLRLNTTNEILKNPKIRMALAYAIDRKALVEKVLKGGQKPAYSITPPFAGYHAPSELAFNVEKAKRLLAESGFDTTSSFPKLRYLTTDSDGARRVAEAIQAMWREHLGINIRIEQLDWSSYLQRTQKMDFDIVASGWIGDFLDPTTFLEMWSTGNGNNNTGWGSKEYEDLLLAAEKISDPNKRYATLIKAETLLMSEMPIIPYYYYNTSFFLSKSVKNWDPLLLDNHPYKYLRLAPPSKN